MTVSGSWSIAIGLALCLIAASAYGADESKESFEYRLGPNDRVRITVYGQDGLSGEFEVDSTGNVSLPLIQIVEASGLTTEELAATIADELQPRYLKDPRVSVDVVEYRPFYIIGEVRNPGSYPFVVNMTVVNAVAVAGGYTYRASKKKIVIIRADDPEKAKQRVREDTRVYPGDVIEVLERYF